MPYGADFWEFLPGYMGGGAAVDAEALADITRTVQVEMAQQVRVPEKWLPKTQTEAGRHCHVDTDTDLDTGMGT